MYGSKAPIAVAAGIPGVSGGAAAVQHGGIGAMTILWLLLLLVMVGSLLATAARLVPRKES